MYTCSIGHPRRTSYPIPTKYITDPKYHHLCYTLSKDIIQIIYIIPILTSPTLQLTMKWGILHDIRITNLIIACLLPLLLMLLCLERHLDYWPDKQRADIRMYSGIYYIFIYLS